MPGSSQPKRRSSASDRRWPFAGPETTSRHATGAVNVGASSGVVTVDAGVVTVCASILTVIGDAKGVLRVQAAATPFA